jgi:hypothetical protein
MADIATLIGIVAGLVAIFVNIGQLKKASRERTKLDLEIEQLRQEMAAQSATISRGDPLPPPASGAGIRDAINRAQSEKKKLGVQSVWKTVVAFSVLFIIWWFLVGQF